MCDSGVGECVSTKDSESPTNLPGTLDISAAATRTSRASVRFIGPPATSARWSLRSAPPTISDAPWTYGRPGRIAACPLAVTDYSALTVNGGNGDDLITGGSGNDDLRGDGGNDRIVGFKGTDHLEGGDGNDVLVWNNGDGTDVADGDAGFDSVEING